MHISQNLHDFPIVLKVLTTLTYCHWLRCHSSSRMNDMDSTSLIDVIIAALASLNTTLGECLTQTINCLRNHITDYSSSARKTLMANIRDALRYYVWTTRQETTQTCWQHVFHLHKPWHFSERMVVMDLLGKRLPYILLRIRRPHSLQSSIRTRFVT